VTFLEAVRQRLFSFLLLLGAALAGSSVAFRFLNFGQGELKFVADFGFGIMFLFGSLLAVVMTAQLLFAELDNRTALTLLAKPVGRSEFLLGKFLGVWAVLGVFIALLCGVLGAVLLARASEVAALAEAAGRVPPQVDAGGLAVFALLQWLRLGLVAALTLLVAAGSRTFLFSVVAGMLATLGGQLQWLAQDLLNKGDAGLMQKSLAWFATRAVPNLQQYNIGDALVLDPAGVPEGAAAAALLSGTLHLLALLAIACGIFRRREI
jgi:ABC-type transport system involved in multi-copper enzyme maturation permease subunit